MYKDSEYSNTMRIDIPQAPHLDTEPKVKAKTQPIKAKTQPILAHATDKKIIKIRREHAPAPTKPAFSEFLDGIYEGVLIADQYGRVVDSNERAREFFQYGAGEICHFAVHQLISGADETLAKTLRNNLEQDRFALIQAYCMRKDGTSFPAEISTSLLKFDDARLCLSIRDITVRRQAEEMLRTGYNAINNSANGIAVANLSGQLVYVNNAVLRIWNCESTSDLVGQDIRKLWLDEVAADTMIRAVTDKQESWSGELVALTRNGNQIYIQITAAANRDSDEGLTGIVLSFTDVSDRKLTEEVRRQAETTQAMLASLAAASHHLSQPATVLLGNLTLLAEMTGSANDEVANRIRECYKACENLAEILHKLKRINVYRTVNYLEQRDGRDLPSNKILDLSTAG